MKGTGELCWGTRGWAAQATESPPCSGTNGNGLSTPSDWRNSTGVRSRIEDGNFPVTSQVPAAAASPPAQPPAAAKAPPQFGFSR
jgi:hypothetical protein